MNGSILVVDDERAIQESLAWCLRNDGHHVRLAPDGQQAMAMMAEADFDLVISDILMPGLNGVELLHKTRALHPRTLFVLITAYATVETAIEALREGASDYVLKPFKLDDLRGRVRRLLQQRSAFEEAAAFRGALENSVPERPLLGDSAAMVAVREQIARIGPAPSSVLITGESGSGKQLVARAIHAASPRSAQPFVAIHCGAVPESRLESQIFGQAEGAFANAAQVIRGLLEAADHGTVLLDEIGELPAHLQVKLLRTIEEKQVWAAGGTSPAKVDVRIMASSTRDLARDVEAGLFRSDLFYRLNVVRIALPPLRERPQDIPLLVDHFVRELNQKLGREVRGIDYDAMRVLMGHRWKGNVRELEHVVESMMIASDGEMLELRSLPRDLFGEQSQRTDSLRELKRQSERQHIMAVLTQTRFDKREAARVLGISLASLYRKLGERRTAERRLQD